jgi:hypothetical protein
VKAYEGSTLAASETAIVKAADDGVRGCFIAIVDDFAMDHNGNPFIYSVVRRCSVPPGEHRIVIRQLLTVSSGLLLPWNTYHFYRFTFTAVAGETYELRGLPAHIVKVDQDGKRIPVPAMIEDLEVYGTSTPKQLYGDRRPPGI